MAGGKSVAVAAQLKERNAARPSKSNRQLLAVIALVVLEHGIDKTSFVLSPANSKWLETSMAKKSSIELRSQAFPDATDVEGRLANVVNALRARSSSTPIDFGELRKLVDSAGRDEPQDGEEMVVDDGIDGGKPHICSTPHLFCAERQLFVR